MSHICPKCGLPEELCVCESIAKENQEIEIKTIKKKFGKVNTVIAGIDSKDIDIKDLSKKLKSEFACGGTAKDGIIELQGDHKLQVKKKLIEMGFAEETIKIKEK
jgi:translation initiation factor 1